MPVYCDSYTYTQDFGPVDIGGVASFCKSLRALMTNPGLNGRPVVYYTFQVSSNTGCNVTKFADHTGLKSIA